MKHRAFLIMVLAVAAVFGTTLSHTAQGACTAGERIDLVQAGYSKAEVESLCEHPTSDIPVPQEILSGAGQTRWSQWCMTPQGSCPLNPMLGYYPVGSACNCYMPWGFY